MAPTHSPSSKNVGWVSLVGAGPGDPELLTLRALDCLQRADAVLYDYLVNPRLLDFARSDAEIICLGRHGRTKIWSQQAINEKIVELASNGLHVVRLKSGDPIVFARGAEEAEALQQAGVSVEIVPGVTSALAAAAYAGIPLTHRNMASAVALVTGHERDAKTEPLDFASLAHFPGTLAIYMGVTTAPQWTKALMDAGMPGDTSAALVRRVSFGDQQTWTGQLDEIAPYIESSGLRPPVIALIGPAARQTAALRWFESRPLFGQRILVTRPREQAMVLTRELETLGAEVMIQPTIEILPPEDWSAVDESIRRLSADGGAWDWVVFSSSNGVKHWMQRLLTHGDVRQLGRAKLAVVGPSTAAALEQYHLTVDLVPETFHAEGLVEALVERHGQPSSPRVLLVRGSRGRDVLREQLTAAGMKVTQVVAYQSLDVEQVDDDIAQRLAEGEVDWITVTSSAIGKSLHRLVGDLLSNTRLASISPITTEALRQCGLEPTVEAVEHTMEGLVAEIHDSVIAARADAMEEGR